MTHSPVSNAGTQSSCFISAISYPFNDKFKHLEEIPSDLGSFSQWVQAQGVDFDASKALLMAALPQEVLDECELVGCKANTWEELRTEVLKATREVLGGANVFYDFKTLKLGTQSVRRYYNRLRNLAELCYPGHNELEKKAMEQFLSGFVGDIQKKLMKRYFKDASIKGHELVCKAQELLSEKRPVMSSQESPKALAKNPEMPDGVRKYPFKKFNKDGYKPKVAGETKKF